MYQGVWIYLFSMVSYVWVSPAFFFSQKSVFFTTLCELTCQKLFQLFSIKMTFRRTLILHDFLNCFPTASET